MIKWSVNLRMETNNKYAKFAADRSHLLKIINRSMLDQKPLYAITINHHGKKVLVFADATANTKFRRGYGYFPEVFPEDDPYQPIYKGMRMEDFETLLKQMGFEKVEIE